MMPDKSTRRPIIDPLLLALKSRRVLIAVVTLLLALVILWVPALAVFSAELLVLLAALALALIGGYSLEDAVRAARDSVQDSGPITGSPDFQALVRNILIALLDELAGDDLPINDD